MKHMRICPKCQSPEILRVDGYAGPYGSGNNIRAGFSVFSAVNVNRYVCCRCGFTEEWVDPEDLPRLIKKYGNP
jgi:ribosomal protein S27AE